MRICLPTLHFAIALNLLAAYGAARADSVGAGQFNLTGTVNISASRFDFGTSSVPPPTNQQGYITTPLNGAFADLAPGMMAGISNIDEATATLTPNDAWDFGTAYPAWVTLPDGIDASLQNSQIQGLSVCTGTAADNAFGNACIPYATSAWYLQQDATDVRLQFVTTGQAYSGSLAGGSTPDVGLFTAYFTGSEGTITGLLDAFAADGSITTEYSAVFYARPSPTPEPGTLSLAGTGLLMSCSFLRRRASATNRA